jgi:hypothetical protein
MSTMSVDQDSPLRIMKTAELIGMRACRITLSGSLTPCRLEAFETFIRAPSSRLWAGLFSRSIRKNQTFVRIANAAPATPVPDIASKSSARNHVYRP